MPRQCLHHCRRRNDPERNSPLRLTRRLELSRRLQLLLLLANLAVAVPVAFYLRATKTGSSGCLPGVFSSAATALVVTTWVAHVGKLRGGYRSIQFLKKAVAADIVCILMQAFALADLARGRSFHHGQEDYHHGPTASYNHERSNNDETERAPCTIPKVSLILTVLVIVSYVHTVAHSARLLASLRRQPAQFTGAGYRVLPTDDVKVPTVQSPTRVPTSTFDVNDDGASVTSSTTLEKVLTPTSSTDSEVITHKQEES